MDDLYSLGLDRGGTQASFERDDQRGLHARIARAHRPARGAVQAWQTLDKERALELAREADRRIPAGRTPGALQGVPVAVKDIIDVRGMVTSMGSPIYERYCAGDERRGGRPAARGRCFRAGQDGDHRVRLPGPEQDAQPVERRRTRRAARPAARRRLWPQASRRWLSARRPTAR